MSRRGPYAKGRAKREEILDAALTMIGDRGYSRTTVRELADTVGLSTTALLHYFGSKDALFTEILRRRDALLAATVPLPPCPADLRAAIVDAVRMDALEPGLVQLSTRLASEGTEPGHAAHDFFRDRYAIIREVTADTVRASRGGESHGDELTADEIAVLVHALIDGLQLQWLYDPEIDTARLMERYLTVLGIATQSQVDARVDE